MSTLRSLTFLISFCFFSSCFSLEMTDETGQKLFLLDYPQKYQLVLPLSSSDSDRFECVYKEEPPGGLTGIHEWIPKGQTLDNWQEMITISYDNTLPKRMIILEKALKQSYAERFGNSKYTFRILKRGSKELIAELKVPLGHKNIPRFSTLLKFVLAPDGVHSIYYEKRFTNIDDSNQKRWLEKLQKSYLVQTSDPAFINLCKNNHQDKESPLTEEFNRILNNDFMIDDRLIVDASELINYTLFESKIDTSKQTFKQIWHQKKKANSEEIELAFFKTPKGETTSVATAYAEDYMEKLKSQTDPSNFLIRAFPSDVDDVTLQSVYFGQKNNKRITVMRMIHTNEGRYIISYTKHCSRNENPERDVFNGFKIIQKTTLASKAYFPEHVENRLQQYFENIITHQKDHWIEFNKNIIRNNYFSKEWMPESQNRKAVQDTIMIICDDSDKGKGTTVDQLAILAKKNESLLSTSNKPHQVTILEKGNNHLIYDMYAPNGTIGGGLKYSLRYEIITPEKKIWSISLGKDRKMAEKERLRWIERIKKAQIPIS